MLLRRKRYMLDEVWVVDGTREHKSRFISRKGRLDSLVKYI